MHTITLAVRNLVDVIPLKENQPLEIDLLITNVRRRYILYISIFADKQGFITSSRKRSFTSVELTVRCTESLRIRFRTSK